MSYLKIEQQSPEWWKHKVGKISGTRFGQLISNRDNSLIEELANEMLDGCCEMSDLDNEDIIFGRKNEPVAIELYEKKLGIKLLRGGVYQNEQNDISMSSPDACSENHEIVVEVKCTMHGKKHLKRFISGIDSVYKPQVINYFVTNDNAKEVHFVSYCPYRPERPIISIIVTRDTIIYDDKKKETVQQIVDRSKVLLLEADVKVKELINKFTEIEF